MTKIAYNACFGGFGLSQEAFESLLDRKGIAWRSKDSGLKLLGNLYYRSDAEGGDDQLLNDKDWDRSDPDLIAVIEALGEKANGACADIRITDIPAGTRYRIDEYDGNERVMTVDDYDWSVA
jgi:hypothetical protein